MNPVSRKNFDRKSYVELTHDVQFLTGAFVYQVRLHYDIDKKRGIGLVYRLPEMSDKGQARRIFRDIRSWEDFMGYMKIFDERAA